MRPVSAQPATFQQVRDLLREIQPAGADTLAAGDGSRTFEYAAAAGPVRVVATRLGDGMRLEIAPVAAAADAPDAPAPAAGPPSAPAASRPLRAVGAPAAAPSGDPAAAMDALFRKMVQEGCSDLHLTSGNPPLYRKDGEITAIGDEASVPAERLAQMLLSITPPDRREQFETTHDADFSHQIPGVARFRCNLFLDRNGMGGVFRVIPHEIPSAEKLGLSKPILDLCHLSKGLVVVTGPTGSGKSTTLAAMVDHINRNRTSHIITIEDPIEFVYPTRRCLINQREVGAHTAGFRAALRAALREDPDIVLVGEMRDLETVAIAIETAETGHLVFGTLHTNTAASALDRMIDQFPTDRQSQIRVMLSESLRGVIAQTLCKKKGGGRVAALEVLFINAAVSNLIREGKTFQIPSIMQTSKGMGMMTLNDALLDLVAKGLVDPLEAYAKSASKAEFKSVLARNGHQVEAA
ncbi:MAG: type IV pilus twitching motility protein PilT [Acidobacteria bacterium]|nr:type IV pilus twitching motility protein PilT [Acidobacteriota bacterium]